MTKLEEVLSALNEVICQVCTDGDHLDSMAISAYSDAIRILAKYGYVEIKKEISHRWIIAIPVERIETE